MRGSEGVCTKPPSSLAFDAVERFFFYFNLLFITQFFPPFHFVRHYKSNYFNAHTHTHSAEPLSEEKIELSGFFLSIQHFKALLSLDEQVGKL